MDKVLEIPISGATAIIILQVYHFENLFKSSQSQFSVEWLNVDYNVGNYFDGIYFTAPENGLYSFNVVASNSSSDTGYISLFVNNKQYACAGRSESNGKYGMVNLVTTLKLVKNDSVSVRINDQLYDTHDARKTFFEGRLVARYDL